jgi:hypothetical protein
VSKKTSSPGTSEPMWTVRARSIARTSRRADETLCARVRGEVAEVARAHPIYRRA